MSDEAQEIVEDVKAAIEGVDELPLNEKVVALNEIRRALHEQSPFKDEPVDFIEWVPADSVYANDYNPNNVAPTEMKLLERSIDADGYTQPIVTWPTEKGREVVDGFHRHRVGEESESVSQRIQGYLPVVSIRSIQAGKNDRIAATIRHNRARGKHLVDSMSDIVVELKRRNWSDEKIRKELGMEQDEVLRLCQITGLAEMFADEEFSRAWDIEGHITEEEFEGLEDEEIDPSESRKVSKNGQERIFHTFDQWECYQAGMYTTVKEGWTQEQCEEAYRDFLSDLDAFEGALQRVITEWEKSCEHYLTNETMNRIAWLGQASCCYVRGIPSKYRSGFSLLTEEQQQAANELALKYLNRWLTEHGREEVTLRPGLGTTQAELY